MEGNGHKVNIIITIGFYSSDPATGILIIRCAIIEANKRLGVEGYGGVMEIAEIVVAFLLCVV